jgi:hypothetical protein
MLDAECDCRTPIIREELLVRFRTLAFCRCFSFLILLGVCASTESVASAAEELVKFTSEAGGFSVLLPGEPKHQVTEVGAAKEKQHQFMAGSAEGVYIVSYQDNPNLEGSVAKDLAAALVVGRDRMIEVFRGKMLESKVMPLAKKRPGLDFRVTIPQAQGEARCRFYMVGTRPYQIIAIGKPEFANAAQAKQVIDSFKFLEK